MHAPKMHGHASTHSDIGRRPPVHDSATHDRLASDVHADNRRSLSRRVDQV